LTIEGTLYAACSLTNTIAVNTTPAPPNPSSSISNQPGDYHIIPVAQIQNVQVLSLAPETDGASGFEGAVPSIARLDLDTLRRREEEAIRKAKERDALRGKGVTREAQEIFDHLSRQ
jgi:protein LSM12